MRTQRRHLSTINRAHTEVNASGTSKTETFVRLLSSTLAASHQPDSGICQIPRLHIERQYRRNSARDFAYAIFQALNELVPAASYAEMFARKRCASTDMLMNDVAQVLHRHRVGMVVINELQNDFTASKNRQSLASSAEMESTSVGMSPNSTRFRPPDADWETFLRQISSRLP